jgi:DNA polymerase-3 subunit epsilon
MYLVFDTETSNGFPRKNVDNCNQKCSIVQLAFLVADKKFNVVTSQNFLLQQDRPICKESQAIHQKTDDMCEKYGVKKDFILKQFFHWCEKSEHLIAHNISFDLTMINIECAKLNLEPRYPLKKWCTMQLTKNIIKLPPTEKQIKAGFTDYKSPSLKGAYNFMFGKDFDNAHDALADVKACLEVFKTVKEKYNV